MNISLRQVEIKPSQTVFITSTGTVLFTSYTRCDQRGYRSITVITSVDDQGSVVEIGLIKWNQNTGGTPSLCVAGKGLMELRRIVREDAPCAVFLASDRRIYRWQRTIDSLVLAPDSGPHSPIAIAFSDARFPATFDPTEESIVLCIQPNGFHLLNEIVSTFMLFERWCGKTRTNYDSSTLVSSTCRGARVCVGEPRMRLIKDCHLARLQHVSPARPCDSHDDAGRHIPGRRTSYLMRSTADLTGSLLRRHKYPSAYGGFGDIWKCDWLKDSRVIEVAVKVMRSNLTGGQTESESKRISRELRVWARLEHECVLPLFGVSFDFGKLPAMVCPWLEGGTLSKFLERNEGLQLPIRLRLLSDIADGLHYLHGCGIVHGDLTGSNVLIKDNGKACISDFGLSRVFMEATGSSYLTSTVRGSIRWAAPELFEIDEEQSKDPVQVLPSPKSDVYSFGSTMLQVLMGKVPYHYYKNDAQVLVALSRGLRPARPVEPAINDNHWEFMQRCWVSQDERASKNVRPSIEEVVHFLSFAIMHCSDLQE